MTRWGKATLIALRSADGLVEMEDHIRLGKTYRVDLDSIETLEMEHYTGVLHRKEIVWAEDDGALRWLPTELLKIEENIQ